MTISESAFLTWDDTWRVGIAEVDAQHQRLFVLINDLHQAMARGKGNTVLASILASLVDYTRTHFAAEERLMQTHGYPEYPSHKQEHDRLTARVLQFQRDFAARRFGISIEVLQFLRDWLQGHISGVDRKYSSFLQAKGVK